MFHLLISREKRVISEALFVASTRGSRAVDLRPRSEIFFSREKNGTSESGDNAAR